MSSDDRNDRDDPNPRDEDRPGVVDRARQKVGAPGLMLAMAGSLALLCDVVVIGLIIANPTFVYDIMVELVKTNVPPGPNQQKQLDDMKAKQAEMRIDTPLNIASAGLGVVVNLLTIIGGLKMRSLSGYGLALTGAITGIIPMGGCCCITLPVGIWALVVLLNPDVKAGFAHKGHEHTHRDAGQYE